MDSFHSPMQGNQLQPRRRFGLVASPNPTPAKSPVLSPTKISLEEYEKEGREETRKELAALFKRLEENPQMTKNLPHVAEAMKSNGKSTAQTLRLRALRRASKQSNWQYYCSILALLAILLALGAGIWTFRYQRSSLPFAAQAAYTTLISTLKDCTLNPSAYNVASNSTTTPSSADFRPECANWVSPVTGDSLLHIAAKSGKVHNVIILLKAGADVHARDRMGRTPLHVATNGLTPTLLAAGSNPMDVDEFGRTPLFYATEETQIRILLDGHPERYLHENHARRNALEDALHQAQYASESPAQAISYLEQANMLLRHMPRENISALVLHKDQTQVSALQLGFELVLLPNPVRRMRSTPIFVDMLSKLSSINPTLAEIDTELMSMDIASKLIQADAVGPVAALLTHLGASSKYFNMHKVDLQGRLPISYVQSVAMLRLLVHSAGLKLEVGSEADLNPDMHPLRCIVAGLSPFRSIAEQYELMKYLASTHPSVADHVDALSGEMKNALLLRFIAVNAVAPEWTINSLLLGLELMNQVSHSQYRHTTLTPQDAVSTPFILKPQTSALLDVGVQGTTPHQFYMFDIKVYTEIDNAGLSCSIGDSKEQYSSSNSFFGGMPRIRLPFDRESADAPHPHFKIMVFCNNYLSPCTLDLEMQTYLRTDPAEQIPLINSFTSHAYHLYSIARLACLLWLPASMLPSSVPIILRYIPFFVSLSGFYPAGVAYLGYWLGYTTMSHLLVRLAGLLFESLGVNRDRDEANVEEID